VSSSQLKVVPLVLFEYDSGVLTPPPALGVRHEVCWATVPVVLAPKPKGDCGVDARLALLAISLPNSDEDMIAILVVTVYAVFKIRTGLTHY
jgi:hypothetical protein